MYFPDEELFEQLVGLYVANYRCNKKKYRGSEAKPQPLASL